MAQAVEMDSANAVLVHRIVADRADVRDISQFGMAVDTTAPLATGQTYVFRLDQGQAGLLLDGEVVRCQRLTTKPESDLPSPVYRHGVAFHVDRHPKEMALLDILQDNLFGEKRRRAARIKPVKPMDAQVATADIGRIIDISQREMVLLTDSPPEVDAHWSLLLESGHGHQRLNSRVLGGVRRADRDLFETRLAFLEMRAETASFLEKLVKAIRQ